MFLELGEKIDTTQSKQINSIIKYLELLLIIYINRVIVS